MNLQGELEDLQTSPERSPKSRLEVKKNETQTWINRSQKDLYHAFCKIDRREFSFNVDFKQTK